MSPRFCNASKGVLGCPCVRLAGLLLVRDYQ
jgi:hypothetical protein